MASVIIKSIGHRGILTEEKFEYVKQHIGVPMKLSDMTWHESGELCALTVFHEDASVITLFKTTNDITYEVFI